MPSPVDSRPVGALDDRREPEEPARAAEEELDVQRRVLQHHLGAEQQQPMPVMIEQTW